MIAALLTATVLSLVGPPGPPSAQGEFAGSDLPAFASTVAPAAGEPTERAARPGRSWAARLLATSLALGVGLAAVGYFGQNSAAGRVSSTTAGLLGGAMAGLALGTWGGMAANWRWVPGGLPQVFWPVLLLSASVGLVLGAVVGGALGVSRSAPPGPARFHTSAIASGVGVLGAAGFSVLLWIW